MKTVQLREAKAKLSALLDAAEAGEATTVTRRGKPVAVIVAIEDWKRFLERAPTFAELLLSFPGGPRDIPRRSRKPMRVPPR